MKKMMIMLAMLTMTLAASAQFEKGRTFVGADVTGLNLSYNGASEFSIGIAGKVGYFLGNNWLVGGQVGYQHVGAAKTNVFNLGALGRYYFQNCGVFLGAHADYRYATENYNDFVPGIEVGYCFFVSHEVAIEPAIYYDQSFKDHSEYSTIGLKVGISLYHDKKQLTGAVRDAIR